MIEFFYKPEFYRDILRSSPKYFLHFKHKGTHIFGLSKFCAFQNISVEEYISKYRYRIGGGTTQKHISYLTDKKWIKRQKMNEEVRFAFDTWIRSFFPNYNLNNASFITLQPGAKKIKKIISPLELASQLELQNEIGKFGELVALKFESERLKRKGAKREIVQVSSFNQAAGYDIYSRTDEETRFIEVKSSLNNSGEFFITSNEIEALTELGNEAYIYFVHITDLKNGIGKVCRIHQDPIPKLLFKKPILYKAKI